MRTPGPLVWDTHCGLFPTPGADLSALDAYRAAGVGFVSLNVGYDALPWTETLSTLSALRHRLRQEAGCVQVRSLADLDAARAAGHLAVAFDIEGAVALNRDPGMVSVYRDLGVMQMLLAYNRNSPAAGGCHDEDCGLTGFGREVLAEMNRVGMIVDLSHLGWRSAAEVMAASRVPCVFTHSNAHAVWPHGRNIPDGLIRDCAAQGGVIGVNGISVFLGPGQARLNAFRAHLDHVLGLVGPAHVALGLDWVPPAAPGQDLTATVAADPSFWPPGNDYDRAEGLDSLSPLIIPDLVAGLRRDGWAEADLAMLLGGNMRRIAAQVWPGN